MNRRKLIGGVLGLSTLAVSDRALAQWSEEPVNELPRLATYRSWWHDRKANVPILHIWTEAQVYSGEWLARDAFDFYTIPDDRSVVAVTFCDVRVDVANIKADSRTWDVDADQVFIRQLLGGGHYIVILKGNLVFIFGFLAGPREGEDEAKEVVRSVLDGVKTDFRYTYRTVPELVPSEEVVKSVSQGFVLEYEDTYQIDQ